MKKALTITIAGTLFTVEEDAYNRLSDYLKSIQNYFGSYQDSQDIIQDIEARIAEQLLSQKNNGAVVTITDVEDVIKVMGRVEDFDVPAGNTQQERKDYKSPRKLYRDPDNVVIAGVASGFANFFGIDPLIMRIIFIVLAIITAIWPSIIIYIILALVIPKAQTPAEKLQMRGGPTNLSSFRDTINEQAEAIRKNGADIFKEDSKPRNFINNIFSIAGKIIRVVIAIIIGIIAVALLIGTVAAIVGSTFAFINLMFNANSPYIEFPIHEVVSGPVYYTFIIFAYLVVLLPIVIIFMFVLSLLYRRWMINGLTITGIVIAWFVALMITGTLATRYAPEVREKVLALPQYQESTEQVSENQDLRDFNKLELHGINNVTFTQAPEYSVVATGRQYDLNRAQFEVEDGVLIMSYKSNEKMCFFCFGSERLDVEISMPDIQALEISGAVAFEGAATSTSDFEIKASGVSRVDMRLVAPNLNLEGSGNSQLTLTGTAQNLNADISGVTRLNAEDFITKTADVEASGNSKIHVNASDSLKVRTSGVSRVTYEGSPQVTQDMSGNSEIEAVDF